MMGNEILLAAADKVVWRLGIGDPTPIGWITVAAYLIAAAGCARAAWRTRPESGLSPIRAPRFWTVLAALMVGLGINKQLDLQTLLTDVGRSSVRNLGLYSEKRQVQAIFIVAVALVCAGAFVALLWVSRRTLRERWLAIVGMLLLLGFVVARASLFHHVDILSSSRVGKMRRNWVLELGGIGCIAIASFRVVGPTRPPRDRQLVDNDRGAE